MTDYGTSTVQGQFAKLGLEQEQGKKLAQRALEQQKQGDFKQAIATYEAALKEAPSAFDSYFNLGICLDKENDVDAAISAFKMAASLKPEDKPTLLHLASLYIEKGDREESMRYWASYQAL